MKRISIVTLMAALVLLSGCNKDNEFSVDIDINNSSEVPIKLGTYIGSTSATTRASINSLDEMVDRDDYRVGVFCLAARRTDVKSAQTESNIDWTKPVDSPSIDGAYGDEYGSSTCGRYWDNLCCKVEKNTIGEYRINPVQEGDDNYKPYYQYYPITSVYGYDFYCYYPYQKDVTSTKSTVSVDFVITGKEDIIYGKSEDVNDAYFSGYTVGTELLESLKKSYYSAKFFRKNPKKTDNAHIKLEHKLARFRFHVFPGPDSEYEEPKSYDDAKKLCVKEIKINQVPNQLRLVVADRANKNNAGTLSAVGSSKSDFYVFTEGGAVLEDDNSPIVLGTKEEDGVTVPDTMEVGDYMMLPSGVSQYFMSVKLADANNPDRIYPSETNIAINLKNGKKFEPGKTYNVYLQVAGLKEIGISAELADWEDGGEMDLVEFN